MVPYEICFSSHPLSKKQMNFGNEFLRTSSALLFKLCWNYFQSLLQMKTCLTSATDVQLQCFSLVIPLVLFLKTKVFIFTQMTWSSGLTLDNYSVTSLQPINDGLYNSDYKMCDCTKVQAETIQLHFVISVPWCVLKSVKGFE